MVLTRLNQPVKISTSSIFVAVPNLFAKIINFNKVKHLNYQIRKIVISQIDFFIRFPTDIVSKKVLAGTAKCARVISVVRAGTA